MRSPYLGERFRRRARAPKPPRTAEMFYERALRNVMRAVHKTFEAHLLGRQDADELDRLALEVQAGLAERVTKAHEMMAKKVRANPVPGIKPNDTGVTAAIAHSREENIRLVEKAARAYAADVRAVMEAPDSFGLSVEDLKERLLERNGVSEARAELIARDQTLKLNGAITRVRQQNAGVSEYIWSTSADDRVRDNHREKEGEKFRWDTPPQDTGHPGEDFQCRCTAIPVFEGDDNDD